MNLHHRLAELEAENERLTRLHADRASILADAVHDLRTPITNLVLRLYLLERAAPESQREHLRDLKQSVSLLKQLTDELAVCARMDWRGLETLVD